MAGRPDYQQLVAILPAQAMANLVNNETANVTAGNNEAIIVYAPAGTICRLTSVFASVAATTGGTAGDQSLDIGVAGGGDIAYGDASYNLGLEFDNGCWMTADKAATPALGVQSTLLHGFLFDAVHGMEFYYRNNTTGGTNSSRDYIATVAEEDLA